MAGIIHVYVGVAEMQLETVVKVWVFGTSLNLGNGIGLEGVNTAKSAKPIGYSATWLAVQSFSRCTCLYSSGTGALFGLPY